MKRHVILYLLLVIMIIAANCQEVENSEQQVKEDQKEPDAILIRWSGGKIKLFRAQQQIEPQEGEKLFLGDTLEVDSDKVWGLLMFRDGSRKVFNKQLLITAPPAMDEKKNYEREKEWRKCLEYFKQKEHAFVALGLRGDNNPLVYPQGSILSTTPIFCWIHDSRHVAKKELWQLWDMESGYLLCESEVSHEDEMYIPEDVYLEYDHMYCWTLGKKSAAFEIPPEPIVQRFMMTIHHKFPKVETYLVNDWENINFLWQCALFIDNLQLLDDGETWNIKGESQKHIYHIYRILKNVPAFLWEEEYEK